MANYASGKYGKMIIGGVTVHLTGWTYRATGKANDTTNSGTDGIETSKVGTIKHSGTFKGQYDLDAQPQDEAPGIEPGKEVALQLYVSRERFYDFTLAEISEFGVDSEVSGMITFNGSFQSQVAPTVPGATAYSESSSGSSSSDSASSSSSLAG